ncbi:MAG: DinB family protein [Caldilinea sp.]
MQENRMREAVRAQFMAAFAMLRATIEQCPASLWDDPADKNRFWQVAYHALFYAHLYLHPSHDMFVPWANHRETVELMDATTSALYTKAELLGFLDECEVHATEQVAALDFSAPSGFHWLHMNKLEVQLYNIRHLQLHIGELAERLSQRAAIDVSWVSRG